LGPNPQSPIPNYYFSQLFAGINLLSYTKL
jgi:hypothetical protein